MVQKKTGRGVWILLFILFSVADESPSDAVIILVGFVIVRYVLKYMWSNKKSLLSGGVKQIIEQLEESAIVHTEQYIKDHPNDPHIEQIQEQLEDYKEQQQEKEYAAEQEIFMDAVAKHTTSGDETAETPEQHSYTSEELSQNYNVEEYVKKDDLGRGKTNPYSLDGK